MDAEKLYRMRQDVLYVDKGTIVHAAENSYEMNICDVCGKRRKCEWIEIIPKRTHGFDCCHSCMMIVLEGVE